MLKIENTEVSGWNAAIRGMRNPMNSWEKSDSDWFDVQEVGEEESEIIKWVQDGQCDFAYGVGPNDQKLMMNLAKAGSTDAKYRRMINVTMDVTAPLYWWKEFDTYKVGTVANSTSTMHKLAAEPITMDKFEFDNLDVVIDSYTSPHGGESIRIFEDYAEDIIDMCENLRLKFKETGDAVYWKALIQILPSAFLQTRTITMSYANLRNIYFQRKNHKLKEWHQFCEDWLPTLPYAKQLILVGENK